MIITREDFDRFWNAKGQYMQIENAERFHRNIGDKINELEDTCLLDHYVSSMRTGKESTRKVIVEFYDFIRASDSKRQFESDLDDNVLFDYPFERQLEIAKFLHEPKTVAEISEHFRIDERTARSDLTALETGFTVLGATVRIEKEKSGRCYFYKSTLHPVFLPLNLTEVYALTVYLENAMGKSDPNSEMIRCISERVKSQLSDYAWKRLYPGEERETFENRYIADETMARQRENIRMYLMKSGQPCKFFWEGNEYKGTIAWKADKYCIRLENGEFLDADVNEVDFIVDSLEYK